MDVTPGIRREPHPDLESVGEDETLVELLRAEIEQDGPITFARFLEVALYAPGRGYYRSANPRPGRDGDFLTAAEAHPIFGAALARAVADAWDRLDRPGRFVLREHGAGTGALGVAILDGLAAERPDALAATRYDPIELDPARTDSIAERLGAAGHADRLLPRDAPRASVDGFVIANEVLDALPTHRVVGRGSELREILVDWRDGAFVDVDAVPTTPALADRLEAEGVTLADGQRGEVCLAVDAWVAAAAGDLGRGVLLLIDYGYPAVELYDPVRRRDGTLRAYLRHRVHDDPYVHVGRQDLTAHVDVTAVERAAFAAGLTHLGTTTQAELLVALGTEELLRAIQTEPATTMEDYLVLRSALVRLLDPSAMGRFRVMAFGRGWPDGPPLAGLGDRLGR
jgi:SAM-dependent MidA family methyltransferase